MGEHLQRLTAAAEAANVPLSVVLELTSRCPLACAHCYITRGVSELPTGAWVSLVDELAELGTMFVTLSGGEPFARHDVLDIAERARARGMAVTLLTSGAVDLDLDRIVTLHPLAVGLSFYSTDATLHDELTGTPGCHARVVATATELARRGVRVRLAAPILAANAEHVGAIADFGGRIGAEVIFDPMLVVRRDGNRQPAQLRANTETLARVLEAVGDRFETAGRAQDEPMCAAGRRVATVLPNGDVLPCSLYPEAVGNVTRTPFADIWRDAPTLARLRGLTIGSLEPECATCAKNSYCGRCGALALVEDGDLLGPSRAACALAEARDAINPCHPSDGRGRLQVCKE